MRKVQPHLLARIVVEALAEDLGPGDATSEAIVPTDLQARGEIRSRNPVVAAGVDVAVRTFRALDEQVQVVEAANDGDLIPAGGSLLAVVGKARALLSAERTALNFLGRLSGIATLTRRFVEAAAPHRPAIADTRKTTPGLRLLEKCAVTAGGGVNHRLGLWDAILIKDNHIDLAGGVKAALGSARACNPAGLRIEVEVRSLVELEEALEAGADEVLLDNFPLDDLAVAVEKSRGRAVVEVSGGVTLESIPRIAALGVDRISIGALTHSAPAADLTMRIRTWKT